MTDPDGVIRAAEEIARILETRGVGAVVIGAVALAAHAGVGDCGASTPSSTRRQAAVRARHDDAVVT